MNDIHNEMTLADAAKIARVMASTLTGDERAALTMLADSIYAESPDPDSAGEVARSVIAQQGDAAALREALVCLRDAARNFCHQILNSKYNVIMDKYTCCKQGFPAVLDLRYAIPKANFAISKPPRNCDVGTAEEQVARHHAYCYRMMKQNNHCCGPCPCYKFVNGEAQSCTLLWAQMPYEQEGGAAALAGEELIPRPAIPCPSKPQNQKPKNERIQSWLRHP